MHIAQCTLSIKFNDSDCCLKVVFIPDQQNTTYVIVSALKIIMSRCFVVHAAKFYPSLKIHTLAQSERTTSFT